MDSNQWEVTNEDWIAFTYQLNIESDRGVALVGSEMLSQLLKGLIGKKLLPDPKTRNKILTNVGSPVSTFSSRIELAYGMGLISNDEYHDLTIIRKIRNSLAHSIKEKYFADEDIKNKINELRIPRLSEYSYSEVPRKNFINGSSMVAAFISMRTSEDYPDVNNPKRIIYER
ncbi:hypothetical protein JR338_07715 [Chloroflexota bacterium]|nr:hypothetical protein JR338_07715 [Chloroflexota bacterium]